MAHLVFKGHETRGKELHKLLENLGGVDAGYSQCCCVTCYYYINREGYIEGSIAIPSYMDKRVIMSLEEFERRYPYKVGDKVNYVKYNDGYQSVYTIQKMRWTGVTIEYLLDSSGFSALTKDLQPYKEETMDKASKTVFDANAQCCDIMNNLIKKETMNTLQNTENPKLNLGQLSAINFVVGTFADISHNDIVDEEDITKLLATTSDKYLKHIPYGKAKELIRLVIEIKDIIKTI
jgi:hypothetical protein